MAVMEINFRLNIACPKVVLMDGLKRLEEGIRLAVN